MAFRRKRIIVADDNQIFVMYIAVLLKRMGFNVIPAENGLEVIKLVKIMEPDLILLDVNMATMDGITTLKYIKGDKETAHIPVVMVSVDGDKETIKKCKTLGSAGYLTKPVKIEKLHKILGDVIFYPLGWKRKYIRAEFNKKVSVTYGGAAYELYSESLSEGGIYIRKKDPFPVGSEINIAVTISGKALSLKGDVIYIKGLFGDVFKVPPGMAVEFKGLKNEEAAMLRDYVNRLVAEDIIESQEEPVIKLDDI